MAFQDRVKGFAKKVVAYPEVSIPSVSAKEYLGQATKDPRGRFVAYLVSLFPIFGWIGRYNLGWFTRDVIAGLTVGIVVVPQGMSYATLANLPVQYGLYTSFVGVMVYCLFATSKDVTIGPVAVMSLTIGQIVTKIEAQYPHRWTAPEIGTTVGFICGIIVLGIGLLRIGWIVEFIPAPAISGFMTGSAINILVGQVPGLLGEAGFNTRAATYQVIINTFKYLPVTKLDAAFGITGLVSLYIMRFGFDWLGKRYPRRARLFFYLSIFRVAFVLTILTLAAYLYCHPRKSKSGKYPIKILLTVPSGLKAVHRPVIDINLLKALKGRLPAATIILLLEHIAIAKSFGRINNYKINPNQEFIAIGVTNTVGSCFGAYAATGSFSRTAIKSKCAVRTPAAGIITGIVVLVALYGLTKAFFWIPTAAISAVIIHAVGDLIASPAAVYSFWRVSPLEFFIWWAAVLVTVFSSIENGIYTSICASAALLLVRIAHPRRNFLGRAVVYVEGPDVKEKEPRDIFIPLSSPLVHPLIKVTPPAPGVIVLRVEESYLYPNASGTDILIYDYVKENIRRGVDITAGSLKYSDRAWNDPGPAKGEDLAQLAAANEAKPALRAIVLDFGAISHIDTTGVQSLIDARGQVERWADHPVEFHFANITSPWIRRALIAGGFGYSGAGTASHDIPTEVTSIVPYRGVLSGAGSPPPDVESVPHKEGDGGRGGTEENGTVPVLDRATPFFHIDLVAAVRAAERVSIHSRGSLEK